MKVYRGTDGDVAPVEMECEKFGYPNRTITGETMYDNTHFRAEREAWDSILESVTAGVKLAAGGVERTRAELAKAEKRAADAAVEFTKAHDNYRDWERKNAR